MDGPSIVTRSQITQRKVRVAPFLGAFLLAGLLFAIQQWLGTRIWYPKSDIHLWTVIADWELQYFLWGTICWLMWRWIGDRLQHSGWQFIVFVLVPLSIVIGISVEMVLVASFPQFPKSRTPMSYWQRLDFSLTEEFLENTAIFWAAFVIVRALGQYKELRQREKDMSALAIELMEARMAALRMQINPHFLFNTMNSISSLMYTDVRAADAMLEQLSNMLRVSLERGSRQMIRLREEIEFAEMYLALQDIRSSGRVRQEIVVEPRLYDALVPTMLLQPLIENAYVHGLSKVRDIGHLKISAYEFSGRLKITVVNSGVGMAQHQGGAPEGSGIGLANIRNRLRLHYGEDRWLDIREVAPDLVEVTISIPLVFTTSNESARPAEEAKILYEA